jgi:hypothetical protein
MNLSKNVSGFTASISANYATKIKGLSWNLTINNRTENGFVFLNNREIVQKNSYFLIMQQIKWKVSKYFSFKNEIDANIFRTNNTSNLNLVNKSKISFDIKKKYYFSSNLDFRYSNQNPSQPFLGFNAQTYFLKNNGLSLELVAKNVFNIKNRITLNQFQNQFSRTEISTLPRVLMLKLIVYPESWK